MRIDDVKRAGGERWSSRALACTLVAIACRAVATGADDPAGGAAAPVAATANPPAGPPAYWQVPPLPTAVIQGGPIPAGWQPQAVPYQGVGPDGRPVTMYFAPTYVFTYQAGPPVPALPQVNRGGLSAPAATPMASGWNYATTGAAPVPTTLAPGTVTRYRPAYQFPDNSRALQGSAVVPPGPLPVSPPSADTWGSASPPAPDTLAPPPTQWGPAAPQSAASAPGPGPDQWAAPAAIGGAAVAAMQPPPAGLPAPESGVAAGSAPLIQPLQPPAPPTVPVARHSWRVVGVYDGDTVTCLDESGQQQKVRLVGIDAPESSQPYGPAAREALAGMVFGRTVEVIDGGRDANGAWLGGIFVDGQNVNRQMVATGNAWADPAAVDPSLAAAQAEAQTSSLGLWAQPNPTPPWSDR